MRASFPLLESSRVTASSRAHASSLHGNTSRAGSKRHAASAHEVSVRASWETILGRNGVYWCVNLLLYLRRTCGYGSSGEVVPSYKVVRPY